MQDVIEREVTLPVPVARAWKAVTESSEIEKWFGCRAEVEMRPGAEGRFVCRDETPRIRIEAVEPTSRFAFRWNPGSGEDLSVSFSDLPLTLVEFLLDEADGGTRLRVRETGFAALPDGFRERAFVENTDGWDEEFANLTKYLLSLTEPA